MDTSLQQGSVVVGVDGSSGSDATEPARVVVGTDGGPASTATLELAFEMASLEGRKLDVAHSWSAHDVPLDEVSCSQRHALVEEHERLLSEALAGYAEKYPDVTVLRHMIDGGAAQALVAMSVNASTVVIGSRGRSGPTALTGSVSRLVLERAHSTVVVVRP